MDQEDDDEYYTDINEYINDDKYLRLVEPKEVVKLNP